MTFARCHAVYSFLLETLELSSEHRTALHTRGFDDREIKHMLYRSLPIGKRAEIVAKVVRKFGDLEGVPGFWRNDRGEWQLAGKSGIAIPVRDEKGAIAGIKLRVDKPQSPKSKYTLLSSNPSADGKTGEVKYPSGTSAKIQLHWPLPKPKVIKTLRITEGELKADFLTSTLDEYTISIPGVQAWRMAIEAVRSLKPKTVLLAFDSDKNRVTNSEGSSDWSYGAKGRATGTTGHTPPSVEDYAVGKALASLFLSLKEVCSGVQIEDWPEECGKGLDDVHCSGNSDKVRRLSGEEADAFARALLAADLPSGWIYIIGTKRFIHTGDLLELDKEQYGDHFSQEEKGSPVSNAIRNPAFRKVDMPIYAPLQEQLFTNASGRRFFNLWLPSKLIRCAGDSSVFMDHCRYVFADEQEMNHFLDWYAFLPQFPGVKILWAAILQGRPGIGKSYFGELMKLILGEHNVATVTNEMLHETYTGWQKKCQLVVVEELKASDKNEMMNKLKPMITQDRTMVREMHKEHYEQPNVFNFLLFTNHEDSLRLDKYDRRYGVFFSNADKESPAYYNRLWKLQEHAPAAFDLLMSRDLSQFNPKTGPLLTEGKKSMIEGSQSQLHCWIEERIRDEEWPFKGDLVNVRHLLKCFQEDQPAQSRYVTPNIIGKILRELGAVEHGRIRMNNGVKATLWFVRNHNKWQTATAEVLRYEYEKWSNASQPGGNPLMDSREM